MSRGWEFIAPSTVVVRGGSHPAVYRLFIDLRAVAESGAGDPVMLASFLQVRVCVVVCMIVCLLAVRGQGRGQCYWQLILSFPPSSIQRRKSPPLAELSIAPKQLLLQMLRSCIQEQLPLPTLRRVLTQVGGSADSRTHLLTVLLHMTVAIYCGRMHCGRCAEHGATLPLRRASLRSLRSALPL